MADRVELLVQKYLKNELSPSEKDELLNESLKCINDLRTIADESLKGVELKA